MTAQKGRVAPPLLLHRMKTWLPREELILAGGAIPSMDDRYAGHSAFKNSAVLDLRQLVDIETAREDLPDDMDQALRIAARVPSARNCWEACQLAGSAEPELSAALQWHAAIRGHAQAIREIQVDTLFERHPQDGAAWANMAAFAVGLSLTTVLMGIEDDGQAIEAVDVSECRLLGFNRLRQLGNLALDHEAALDEIAKGEDEPAIAEGMASALAAMKKQQPPDPVDEIPDFDEPRGDTLLVIPLDPALKPSGARADVFKSFKHVIGNNLLLVSTDKLPSARTELHARHPHMHAEIDRILGTQVSLQHARFNVLLVGDPGLGKTTLARDIAECIGLPQITYGCAGAHDASFGGTSAQWNSARSSVPLQLVARSQKANPCVVLDQIDMVGTSKHNGSLSDVLLSFLEPSSARSFHDLALEMDVDLSAVSYIATANTIEDVPAALRDRFTVVRVPAPGWQHIGSLSERILDDLAAERGLDRRWLEPLAEDEIDVVKATWPGGSLRRLQRAIRLLVDGREQLMGRA